MPAFLKAFGGAADEAFMRRFRLGIVSVTSLILWATAAMAAAPSRAGAVQGRGPSIPFRILLLPLRLVHARRPEPMTELDRVAGSRRSVLDFDVNEPASSLYLEIHGDFEFERVDVTMSDGSRESVDAFGSVRSNGIFEVCQFESARAVHAVRVIGRARGDQARIGLRLGV